MPETELLIPLAEIAGVFVGFGALIAVRAGGAGDAHEITFIRSVVTIALWVIIAALVLVVLGLFPDQEPALYLTAVGLGLLLGALTLLFLVFQQGRPQPASEPAPLPATGGSSA
jgi:drug/metabolite transporter (DMT)-like permease